MSRAYNRKKKEIRRILDEQNPARRRVRREIRLGRLPRFLFGYLNINNLKRSMFRNGLYTFQGKDAEGNPLTYKRYIHWPLTRSTFKEMSRDLYEKPAVAE